MPVRSSSGTAAPPAETTAFPAGDASLAGLDVAFSYGDDAPVVLAKPGRKPAAAAAPPPKPSNPRVPAPSREPANEEAKGAAGPDRRRSVAARPPAEAGAGAGRPQPAPSRSPPKGPPALRPPAPGTENERVDAPGAGAAGFAEAGREAGGGGGGPPRPPTPEGRRPPPAAEADVPTAPPVWPAGSDGPAGALADLPNAAPVAAACAESRRAVEALEAQLDALRERGWALSAQHAARERELLDRLAEKESELQVASRCGRCAEMRELLAAETARAARMEREWQHMRSEKVRAHEAAVALKSRARALQAELEFCRRDRAAFVRGAGRFSNLPVLPGIALGESLKL